MTSKRQCPKCGAEQASSALQGLCPDCIIKVTLAPLAEMAPTEPSLPPPPTPRLRYFGDYELLEEIAHGGMGVVWRARQISLNRIVAVKMIRAGLLASDAEVRRFHAEAEAAASLDHPNIVPLYEVGEHAGQQYFSMKLIEGRPLSTRMEDRAVTCPPSSLLHLPFSSAALLAKVARAVHHAHQRGILHRDLKPGNILVDGRGEPHITDFGLALRLESETHFTMTGAILGTPSYMSPEQAGGKVRQLTTAADIYSLGAILYELLTGRPPLRGETPLETLRAVVEQAPVPPWVARRRLTHPANPKSEGRSPTEARSPKLAWLYQNAGFRIPQAGAPSRLGLRASDLDIICLKCLEKDPQRRYASALELADDLERFARGEPIQARPTGRVRKLQLWCRRRPLVAGLGAGLIALCLIGFAAVYFQWRQTQDKLWHSNLAQAQARRLTGQQGQRFESLQALSAAWKIRPDPVLRDEAIACLVLDDLDEEPDTITFTNRFADAAFDPELKRAAVAFTDGQVRLLEFTAPRAQATLPATGSFIQFLRFSPDGQWLLGRATNEIVVWKVADRTVALREATRRFQPVSLAADFHQDSRRLAFGDGRSAVRHYWLTETNAWVEEGRVRARDTARAVAWLESGVRSNLAVLAGETIELWAPGGSVPVQVVTNVQEACVMVWQDYGHIAVGYSNGLARTLVFADQGRLRFDGHILPVRRLCLDEARLLLLTAGTEGTTSMWEISSRRRLLQTPAGQAVQLSRDGRRVAFERAGHELGVWRLHLGEMFWTRDFSVQAVDSISVHPARDEMVVTTKSGIGYYEIAGPLRHTLARQGGYTRTVIPPGQNTLWVAQDRHLQGCAIPPPGPGRLTAKFARLPPVELSPGPPIQSLALAADGRRLLATTEAGIEWLDPLTGACQPFATNVTGLEGLAVSPDGRWVATGSRAHGRPRLWDAQTGQPGRLLGEGSAAVAFSPDGDWLVVGGVEAYAVWDTVRWEKRWTIAREPAAGLVGRIAFAGKGGRAVLQGSVGQLQLYDLRQGRLLARLQAPQTKRITALANNAEGTRVIAGCHDGTLQIWDLAAIERELERLGFGW